MNAPRAFIHVLERDAQDRPVRAYRHFVRPLDDDDRGLGEEIFDAQRFEIVKISDSVEIDVIDADAVVIIVDERKRRAGDILFSRGAEAGDKSLRQRRFSSAELT